MNFLVHLGLAGLGVVAFLFLAWMGFIILALCFVGLQQALGIDPTKAPEPYKGEICASPACRVCK